MIRHRVDSVFDTERLLLLSRRRRFPAAPLHGKPATSSPSFRLEDPPRFPAFFSLSLLFSLSLQPTGIRHRLPIVMNLSIIAFLLSSDPRRLFTL